MKTSEDILQKLLCPSTNVKLRLNGDYLESVVDSNIRYPVIDGIPVLIQ